MRWHGHPVEDTDQRSPIGGGSVSGQVLHSPAQSLPVWAKLLPSSLLLYSDKPDAVYFSGCHLRSCRSSRPPSCQSKPARWQPLEKLDPFHRFPTSAIYIGRQFNLQKKKKKKKIDQGWLSFRCSQEVSSIPRAVQGYSACNLFQPSRGLQVVQGQTAHKQAHRSHTSWRNSVWGYHF